MSTATVQPGRRAITATPQYRGAPLPDIPTRAEQGGLWRRMRRQTLPWKIMGGLLLAAAAAQLAIALTGDAALIALAVAVTAAVATIASAMYVRGRRGSVAATRWLLNAAAGCVWLTWTAFAGLTWTAFTVLVTLGAVLSLRHWRDNRIPVPAESEPEPGQPQVTPIELWDTNLGAGDGVLKGSYLTHARREGGNLVYDIQLRPGRQDLEKVLSQLGLIATGLHTPVQNIVIEEHPTSEDPSLLQLTIVRKSPVKQTLDYPGPQLRWEDGNGIIDFGVYADGNGRMPWKLFTKGSVWGGFIVGGIGSGKSRLMENIGCSLMASGLVTVWFADPQGGTSSVALADHAARVARDPDECLAMLQALKRVCMARGEENSRKGRTGFKASPERPALIMVLDECHMVFSAKHYEHAAEATAVAEYVARIGRKLGVQLILASQEGDLDTFGRSNPLRAAVRAGNTVVLRTENRQVKGVLNLPVDPMQLPKDMPGYGYTVAGTQLGGRTAPGRAYYLAELEDDEYEHMQDTGGDPREGTSYWWLSQQSPVSLDAVAAGAARSRAAVSRPAVDSPARPAALPGGQPAHPFGGGDVIQFPRWNATAPADPPSAVQPAGRQTAVDVVHRLICQGVTATGDLIDRSGYSEPSVRRALEHLAATGRVRRDRHGVWVRAS
jgi:hypothetical protein